jgi:hypothetical protein
MEGDSLSLECDQLSFISTSAFKVSVSGWDVAEWLERLTDNAEVATVLGSIPASSDTVESEGRQRKQCWIQNIENVFSNNPPVKVSVYC